MLESQSKLALLDTSYLLIHAASSALTNGPWSKKATLDAFQGKLLHRSRATAILYFLWVPILKDAVSLGNLSWMSVMTQTLGV